MKATKSTTRSNEDQDVFPTGIGCLSLVTFPQSDSGRNRMLKWTRRGDSTNTGDYFAVYDNDRRIEILTAGLYRLQIYLEPSGKDPSKYFLEVNGVPLSTFNGALLGNPLDTMDFFVAKSISQSQSTPSNNAVLHEELPLRVANVAEIRLNKWDMVMVRRAPHWWKQYGACRTPFGRFVLTFVRN